MVGIRESVSGHGVLWGALFVAASLRPQAAEGAEPEETIPALMRQADEGPSEARSKALEELGRIGDKSKLRDHAVGEFLLRFIRNERQLPRLRKKAVEAIIALARDTDPSIRERVLEELVRLLERSSERNSVRWRIAAEIWVLVDPKGLGADRRAIAALERVASGKGPAVVRAAALRSLGRIGAESSLKVIRAALSDRNGHIARAAWKAFEEYFKTPPPRTRDLPALGKLMAEHIADTSSPLNIRAAAMKTVAHMGYKPAIPKIENVLKTENEEQLVLAGLEALSIFGEPRTAGAIVKVYGRFEGTEGSRVRASACSALGDLYQPLAETKTAARTVALVTDCLIRALYEDESAEVARAAAYYLGNLAICGKAPREKAIEALIDALVDPDNKVRENAADSLGELTLHEIEPREGESIEDYQKRWRAWFGENGDRFRS